ncbi:MAG: hypothetical protein JSS81_15450 [Acidobacteria bacterium]|nr:hypothetical protein [Acidobacteriota bacterium]
MLTIASVSAFGQAANIGQFAVWKPKDGQLQNFENGYRQHLDWHRANGDKWSWYGWFIASGARYGQFVDATFDHSWADFDKAVKPAEDLADNRLHVFPFGDVQTVFKVAFLPEYSTADAYANKLRLVRNITIRTDDLGNGLKVVEKLRDFYVSKRIKSFRAYRIVDGGPTDRIMLMLGFAGWEEFGMTESWQEKAAEFERSLKVKTLRSVDSETLVYRADMSLFPDDGK